MFAIVRTGGKQYRVAAEQKIIVDRLPGEAGDSVSLTDVLLVGEGDTLKAAAAEAARYEAAMRDRNRLLAEPAPDAEWLAALEAQMALHGEALDVGRRMAARRRHASS